MPLSVSLYFPLTLYASVCFSVPPSASRCLCLFPSGSVSLLSAAVSGVSKGIECRPLVKTNRKCITSKYVRLTDRSTEQQLPTLSHQRQSLQYHDPVLMSSIHPSALLPSYLFTSLVRPFLFTFPPP